VDEIDFTRAAEPEPGREPALSRLALPAMLAVAAVVAGSALALWSQDGQTGEALARVEFVPARTPEVLLVALPASPAPGPLGPTPTSEREPEAAAPPGEAPGAAEAPVAPTPQPLEDPAPAVPGALAGITAWSNGDSTSYYMSAAFLAMVERAGGTAAIAPSYVVSSGLLNPNLHDWPANLVSEMALHNPEVVVFMLGANDANGAAANPEAYRARVGAVMDQLNTPGRRVAWVGQPIMGRDDLAVSVPVVNRIFEEEAAIRPWVTYVDTYGLTMDASGSYATHLPGPDGEPQLMRADDGVHLTPAAGERLARAVFMALFPDVPVP
jgi:hypothetical protein